MKASAYMSIGDWSKSVDVEIDSSSESDVSFAKSILSSISEIKEKPKTISLNIAGEELAKTVRKAIDSALGNDTE